MKETTLITVNELQNELETISNQIGKLGVVSSKEERLKRKMLGLQSDLILVLKEFKVITSRLENEIIRTEKGKTGFERSKKAEELRRQGRTTEMFKVMFGQS